MLSSFEEKKISLLPRLPLEGTYFLTHRCNNVCRHCWVSIPADSSCQRDELTFVEIKMIAQEARSLGCRKWSITGGEPMLRDDFCEIFDFLTSASASYILNTNGTLINPKVTRLLKRNGLTLVSLYGATAAVHDYITRRVGSFTEALRGIAYLKEAGVKFMVQIMPMRDNLHQYGAMVRLAKSLSGRYRLGGEWLYLSAQHNATRNREIIRQRLPANAAIELAQPQVSCEEIISRPATRKDVLKTQEYFSACVARSSFSLDPYGRMSFCPFVQDSRLLYDVRGGSFAQGWKQFIPAAAKKITLSDEYRQGCASCVRRPQCKWCPAYAYLETGDCGKKIPYACRLVRAQTVYKKQWITAHRKYYQVAGITLQVDSDIPITDKTFHKKFSLFETASTGKDCVRICHHQGIPRINRLRLGKLMQRSEIYEIFKNDTVWTYIRFDREKRYRRIYYLAVCDHNHCRINIYHWKKRSPGLHGLGSVTFPGSDRVLLVPLLAARQGCIFHASGVILEGKGFMFLGPSGAGKSTISRLLAPHAIVLCDESIIVRKQENQFVIYGNWCHGTYKKVSALSAPLAGIFVLKKSFDNGIEPLYNKEKLLAALLSTVNRSLMTQEWWEHTLEIIGCLSSEVNFYRLRFDKSGSIVQALQTLC